MAEPGLSSIAAPRWRSISPDAIMWREWHGEFVVRNERSGSSHLLGTLAGKVLQVLVEAERALSAAEIATLLGGQKTIAADIGSSDAINEVLAAFHHLELAEPMPQ